jgi:hypothetical protein
VVFSKKLGGELLCQETKIYVWSARLAPEMFVEGDVVGPGEPRVILEADEEVCFDPPASPDNDVSC